MKETAQQDPLLDVPLVRCTARPQQSSPGQTSVATPAWIRSRSRSSSCRTKPAARSSTARTSSSPVVPFGVHLAPHHPDTSPGGAHTSNRRSPAHRVRTTVGPRHDSNLHWMATRCACSPSRTGVAPCAEMSCSRRTTTTIPTGMGALVVTCHPQGDSRRLSHPSRATRLTGR